MTPDGSTSAMVVVAAVVLLVLYDLIAYARGGNPATVSRVMLRLGSRSLLFALSVAFTLGALVGHFFLPQRPKADEDTP